MNGCRTISLADAVELNLCRAPLWVSSWPTGWVGTWFVELGRSLHQAHDGEAHRPRLGVVLPPDATKDQAAEIITKETASRVLLRLDLARPSQVSLL